MTTHAPEAPRVFISYSHDSREHADRVLALSDRLRADGIDCTVDQYEPWPPEGWPRWMERQISEAHFVLMVCTSTYWQRVERKEKPGIGLGVLWESNLICQNIYDAGTINSKFIPALLEGSGPSDIPLPLRGATHYRLDTDAGYEDLYRQLTSQPRTSKPELGRLRRLTPRERKQDFFARIWDVPYERNSFFTGRNNKIEELHAALLANGVGALTQAISGLGGTGKTQVAVEYVYRYRDRYSAVFWVRADSDLSLKSGFLEIARSLSLPVRDEKNSDDIVQAVRRWLEVNAGWLLIFDNADSPDLVKPYRPLNPQGHILLSSRAQVFQTLGISRPIDINEMSEQEALEFLFRRTGREDGNDAERAAAKGLACELGYFPLALEQAGAYITHNQVRFQDYLAGYNNRRLELLSEFGPVAGDYHESVATTWSVNFDEVKKSSQAAADLLCFSAFLNPDSIPLELITKGASQLGPALSAAIVDEDLLAVNSVLEPLTRYSLIRRDIPANTYSIHRLVQEVVNHGMDKDSRRLWAQRTVDALNEAFPEVEFINWPLCERLLSHAKEAARLVADNDYHTLAAARVLDRAGQYLLERGTYAEAEPLLKLALSMREKILGQENAEVATSLNNLAALYRGQGKYGDAESLCRRALDIFEKVLGPEHPDFASNVNNLASLCFDQGRYAEAEPLFKRALAIREKVLGEGHPDLANSLNNLAGLFHEQGKYDVAESLFRRALEIRQKLLGPEHPDLARSLNNLARVCSSQGRYVEAESLYRRALAIRQKALGSEHRDLANSLNNLANLYYEQGKYAEAEALCKQALVIRKRALGAEHPDLANSLNDLAALYHKQGKDAQAESLYKRAVDVCEKSLGPAHPHLAVCLRNLANLHVEKGKDNEAEGLYRRALVIHEKALGHEHPHLADNLNSLSSICCRHGRYAEAEPLLKRALSICEKALGPEHPDLATRLLNYAQLLRRMNFNHQAAKVEARAKRILKKGKAPS